MSSKFSMWDPRKNVDFEFFDDVIREMFEVGGVAVYLHKYLGVYDQNDSSDPSEDNSPTAPTNIQDLFLLENRDRQYDTSIYELRGLYNLQDVEYSLQIMGLMLDNDTIYIEFHLNDILEKIERKLMNGDVLEFPHLRDDALLDPNAPAVNKYYVVQEVIRSANGYSPTWRPHILRIKASPITDSQEFSDILDQPLTDANGDPLDPSVTLGSVLSTYNTTIGISNAILQAAEDNVPLRNFQTAQFYVVPGDEEGSQYPWVFAGDGIPPDGAQLAGTGNAFPLNPTDKEWFLRIDYDPAVLFQYVGPLGIWERREVDLRRKWEAAHRILESFINDRLSTTIGDLTIPEKQALSKVILPRADF